MTPRLTRGMLGLTVVAAAVLSGCGNGSDLVVGATPSPSRTQTALPTPTRTPTVQTTSSGLAGLVVVRDDVAPNTSDLGTPPTGWGKPADEASFDRSFANADYSVDGVDRSGTTSADGGFVIPDLPPGRYMIDLTKTVGGNLLPISVPVVIGADGETRLVVEVGMGLVRTTSNYAEDGVAVQVIGGPYGTRLILRDGKIVELADPSRALIDADGDGQFDTGNCPPPPTRCGTDDRTCADGTFCQCVSSCPFCDNCEFPGVCGAGMRTIYKCGPEDSCALPGDRCIDTCPECFNGGVKVCVPSCEPVDVTAININGPSQLVIGRETQLYATAQLSDGSVIDVTYLADWQSSNNAIASVDSWGRISAVTTGNVTITVRLGDSASATFSFAVVARPTLNRIVIQNTGCYCGPYLARPETGDQIPCYYPATDAASLPYPGCRQTIIIGATLQFTALGEYADNSYEDLTKSVQWSVDPSTVGDIETGLFTGRSAGTANVQASLDGVTSDRLQLHVVAEATVESLSIYPSNYAYDAVRGGPLPPHGGISSPCFNCGVDITVLRNDTLRFQATAHYNTGDWRDVTEQVTWRTSNAAVTTIDGGGVMTAIQGGEAAIDASLDAATSNPVNVRVVNEATLDNISIYQEGTDRVVAKADQRFFRATAVYDIGIVRDITRDATWHSSNDSVGSFENPGVFTARAAGFVQVWAQVDEKSSAPLSLEVYETTELTYCDAADVNRGIWSDDFNRVVLESDCRSYTLPGVVTLRYTVTETRPHGGIFDPCLDLYVYDGDRRIRTIREQGCGEPFLPNAAPGRDEAAVKYQLRAFWDLKDDNGVPVEPGTYSVHGRFYLYYDPVVSITVEVGDGSSTPRPTRPPASPTPTAAPDRVVALSVGSASGRAGDQVVFQVAMKSIGIPVAGLQNDLYLSGGLTIDRTDAGRPKCSIDAGIDKPASGFAFLDGGCDATGVCDNAGVRALIVAVDNVDPIPDGAVVYRCTTTIPEMTPDGVYPINCENAAASDPRGGSVMIRCARGSIRVGSPGEAPTAPSDVQGNCFVGSASCDGNSFYATARERCCSIAATAFAVPLSWCPATEQDADGKCMRCESPCAAIP